MLRRRRATARPPQFYVAGRSASSSRPRIQSRIQSGGRASTFTRGRWRRGWRPILPRQTVSMLNVEPLRFLYRGEKRLSGARIVTVTLKLLDKRELFGDPRVA